jgi:hypothetical protein
MARRVQFSGDPKEQETGTGRGPDIPLSQTVQPTSVEMLGAGDPDAEQELDEEEVKPKYERERIGSRIGLPVEGESAVDDVEHQLDTEDVVPMMFSREVRVQDKGLLHTWGPGVHMVPMSLAGDPRDKNKPMHWYLKRHKVRRVGNLMAKPPADAG